MKSSFYYYCTKMLHLLWSGYFIIYCYFFFKPFICNVVCKRFNAFKYFLTTVYERRCTNKLALPYYSLDNYPKLRGNDVWRII